jgi:hypothetical protein
MVELMKVFVAIQAAGLLWAFYRDWHYLSSLSNNDHHERQKQVLHENWETAKRDGTTAHQNTKFWAEKWLESQTELKALKAQSDNGKGGT